jgi:hypothetical protein
VFLARHADRKSGFRAATILKLRKTIMRELFTKAPIIPAAGGRASAACEWVQPAARVERRDHARLNMALPAGMPDWLQVDIVHSREGVERSTAAVYGGHFYMIHYIFTPRGKQD